MKIVANSAPLATGFCKTVLENIRKIFQFFLYFGIFSYILENITKKFLEYIIFRKGFFPIYFDYYFTCTRLLFFSVGLNSYWNLNYLYFNNTDRRTEKYSDTINASICLAQLYSHNKVIRKAQRGQTVQLTVENTTITRVDID